MRELQAQVLRNSQLPLVWHQLDDSRYIQSSLLIFQKTASTKMWRYSRFHFPVHFQPCDSTVDSYVATVLLLTTESTHISLRWQQEIPLRSCSKWEDHLSARKLDIPGVREELVLKWLKGHLFPDKSFWNSSLKDKGCVPILKHVPTQGTALEVQKIEKNNSKSTFVNFSSFPLLPYYFILLGIFYFSYLGNGRDVLELTSWPDTQPCHFSLRFMDFTNLEFKLLDFI